MIIFKVALSSQGMVQGHESDFENLQRALFKLIQKGLESEYQVVFKKLMNRITKISETPVHIIRVSNQDFK